MVIIFGLYRILPNICSGKSYYFLAIKKDVWSATAVVTSHTLELFKTKTIKLECRFNFNLESIS